MAFEEKCVNCKKFKGNCGHHLIDDQTKHIVYDCPAEYMYDRGFLTCFIPSDEYMKKLTDARIKEIIDKYDIDEVEEALKMLKGE